MDEIILKLIKKNYLVSEDFLSSVKSKVINLKNFDDFLKFLDENNFFVVDIKAYNSFLNKIKEKETQKKENKNYPYGKINDEGNKNFSDIEILESYTEKNVKISVNDFVNLYNKRFISLQSILRQRKELEGAVSIKRISFLDDKENVSFIGMISEINYTKNNNLILTLEDNTGKIKAILTKNKELEFNVKELTLDEVIGIVGVKSESVVFVNSIILPDVPLNGEPKKSLKKESAVFISDVHIGSKAFLKKQFENFVEWLKGNYGDENLKELSKYVKYLFIIGDLVEGIGIFPDQEKDLEVLDIYEQYSIFSGYIKKIPNHIRVIIAPGNHDSLRIAEPQPQIPKELVPELYDKENIFFVSSPSLVKIAKDSSFSGFDVLVYHGFSFPYYADAIEPLRIKGGLENTENILHFLLRKRHLAPTHGSTQYQLGYDEDPLVIKKVPDFFVSGHVHRASVKNYRNVILLNCGCWVTQTEYQEKRGLVPMPAKAIYVDLSTRETKILDFMN
ncbi:MAG: metallophosphoesterase [Candidatus Woesearchaeota archaeon]